MNLELPTTTSEFLGVLRDAAERCPADEPDWKALDALGVFDVMGPESADPENAQLNAVTAIEALSSAGVQGPLAETMWMRGRVGGEGGELVAIASDLVVDGRRLVPHGMVSSSVYDGHGMVDATALNPAELNAQRGHAWVDDDAPIRSFQDLDPAFAWRGASAVTLGLSSAALDRAVEHARERVQFGKPIGTFQTVQFRLTEAALALDGLRFLLREAAWRADRDDERSVPLSALVWIRSREIGRQVTRHVHQVFGAIGFTEELGVARLTGAVTVQRVVLATDRAVDLALSTRSLAGEPSSTVLGGFTMGVVR